MNLKSLTLIGLLSGLSACSNQAQSIFIERFYALEGCDAEANREKAAAPNGYLDVAAGAPSFQVGIQVGGANTVMQMPIVIGQTSIEQANRDRPLITQQVVTYRLSKRLGTAPKPFITNLSQPFVDGVVFGGFQLISAELGTQLFDGLTPSSGLDDFVDVFCDVEFKGEFSASKTPFTTGVLTFPIRAFRSNPAACANGYQRLTVDMMSGMPDLCSYVGQRFTQLALPPAPSCCRVLGNPEC